MFIKSYNDKDESDEDEETGSEDENDSEDESDDESRNQREQRIFDKTTEQQFLEYLKTPEGIAAAQVDIYNRSIPPSELANC